MPSIPLPFVLSLLLAILFARMARQGDRSFTGRAFLALVGACAVQTVMMGLRWSIDPPVVRFLQPLIASTLPPLAWISFGGLRRSSGWTIRSIRPHLLPVVAVAAIAGFWRPPLDLVLVAIFIGYGVSLLWLARLGSDELGATRLGDEGLAHRALVAVGLLLLLSSLVDLAVAADFSLARGAHAAGIVAVANVVTLAMAGYAAAIAGGTRPDAGLADESRADETPFGPEDSPARANGHAPDTAAGDAATIAAIDRLMRERRLYRDPNLTLERLARRAGIPARQISGAVNRVHGRNLSQVINEYRVEDARELLAGTEAPVTSVMFDCGFQTKSNFNREFLRVAGMSPSDYRRSANGHRGAGSGTIAAAAPLQES